MSHHYRVSFLGFSEFERSALTSYFRLASSRTPRYDQVQMLTDAEFLVADADHAPSVQLVVATERLGETVFIGSHAPPGAVACMRRPIDALHVMRELDAMVAASKAGPAGTGAGAMLPIAPPELITLEPAEEGEESTAAAPLERPPAADDDVQTLLLRSTPHNLADGPAPRSHWAPSDSLLERAAANLPAPPMARVPPPALPPLPPQPPRALIVDDSEIAMRFLEAHLEPWGLVVDRASHSGRAMDLLMRHSYDLVFLDVELGPHSDLDGLALCQHIKHSTAAMSATVIIVSAHHTELDRVRGALAGCDAFLGKPLDAAELQRLLRRRGLKRKSEAERTTASG